MPTEKCKPGCPCKKHTRYDGTRLSEAERRERRKETYRRYYLANADKLRAYAQGKREAHPEKLVKYNTPEAKSRYHLKSKYGITPERRAEMLAAQGGCCYLCGDTLVAGSTHIDHDHACCSTKSRSCGNCIRGLACQKCNQGIGQFGDDPERMRRAADNLEKANCALRERAAAIPVQEMLPFGQVA